MVDVSVTGSELLTFYGRACAEREKLAEELQQHQQFAMLLVGAQARIEHLESLCRHHGINPDEALPQPAEELSERIDQGVDFERVNGGS